MPTAGGCGGLILDVARFRPPAPTDDGAREADSGMFVSCSTKRGRVRPVAMTPELLLERLNQIARSLAASGSGLALIGLGSVGEERERLDAWSDLDFFAIVGAGN